MATAVASKPLPQTQKMKRPPPPYLQTSTNAIRPPNPSPSPSSASKRFSSPAFPPSANSQNGLYANGTGPRPNRQRKESQRMGEPTGRPQRVAARNGTADGLHLERRSAKRYPEPYGKESAFVMTDSTNLILCAQWRVKHIYSVNSRPTYLPSSSIYIQHIFDSISRKAVSATTLKCACSLNTCRKKQYRMTCLKSFGSLTSVSMMVGSLCALSTTSRSQQPWAVLRILRPATSSPSTITTRISRRHRGDLTPSRTNLIPNRNRIHQNPSKSRMETRQAVSRVPRDQMARMDCMKHPPSLDHHSLKFSMLPFVPPLYQNTWISSSTQ